MSSVASPSVIDRIASVLGNLEATSIHHDPAGQDPSDGVFDPGDSLGLQPDTLAFVRENFPSGLYRHQHKAISRILAGENTVVATRTSSGKSLIFALPVLDQLCVNPSATSLFLYPQKALANDQLLKLREFAATTPAVAYPPTVSRISSVGTTARLRMTCDAKFEKKPRSS